MKKKKNKKVRNAIVIISKLMALVTVGASIYLFSVVYGFKFLPSKLILLAAAGLIVVNLPQLLIGLVSRIKSWLKIIQILICIILSGALITGSILLPKYEGKIAKAVTSIPEEGSLNIDVYVLNDSEIKSVKDLSNARVGLQSKNDAEYQEYALKVINHEIEGYPLNKIEFDNIYDAVDALLNKEVDAILLNETYFDVIADNKDYENIEEQVSAIYQCPVAIKLDFDTNAVGSITTEPFIIAAAGRDTWSLNSLSTNGRTDVNMVIAVNPVTKRVLIVSLPRDSYVGMGGNKNKMDKLTHSSLGGITQWEKTLEGVLNVKINYFIKVNFSSIVNVVDAVGGIDINNPYEFSTKYVFYGESKKSPSKDGTKTTYAEGKIHLDGPQALGYCRERKSLNNGDLDRNKHQAIVMKGIIDKVCSVSVITKVASLLDAINGIYISDLKLEEYYALAQMQLNDMANWTIDSYSLKAAAYSYEESYYGGCELSMVILSDKDIKTAHDKIMEILNGVEVPAE